MTFREWRYSDILKISELEKECFPQEPWSFKTLASGFGSDNFFGVVAEDGEVAGYGSISLAVDTADIGNIAVAEAYRRCGAGSEILTRLVDYAEAKGVKKVFLEVRVSNSPAMMMYLKHGFKGVYARTRYYSDGEDCLVMAKEL